MSNTVSTLFEKRTRAFPLGPDKTALFLGRDYRHALEGIRDGLKQGCRLLCLVGPAGMGKSMLLRTLRSQLPRGIISEISQPPLGGLLSRLAAGLGMENADNDEAAVQQRFQEYFAQARQDDGAVIQVIDDAEYLSHDDLALLCRLFEPVQGQILLVGQPPLLSLFDADDGSRTEIEPDRIYYLEPLSSKEVGAYIRHRLNEAGYDRELFVPEAIAAVDAYSGGLPRLINLLCFMALASSEFDVSTPITAEAVHDAARQRMGIGNYPFMRPPLAPGWRPIPTPATEDVPDELLGGRQDVDENNSFIAGKLRWMNDRATRLGHSRILLTLMVGVTLGIFISQLWMTGSTPPAAARSAASDAAMSHPWDGYLQGMKKDLVDMAEWVINWAGPESSPDNSAVAPARDNSAAVPAPHLQDTSNQAAISPQNPGEVIHSEGTKTTSITVAQRGRFATR